MNNFLRRTLNSGVMTIAAGTLFFSAAVQAQYPKKPVKIVVGFSAGGGIDTAARGFASYIHEAPSMGEMPAVIINLPGGSATKAAKKVAKGKADGYTLFMTNAGTTAASDLAGKSKVDSKKDFETLGCVSQLVTGLLVHTSTPQKSAFDWVKAMKDSGKTVRWSSPGATTFHALVGRTFFKENGIKNQIVPFKGGSKARNALVAQKVDASFVGVQLTAGFESDLRALGVPTAKRDPANKTIATFGEQGLHEMDTPGPLCLYAPKGIPADAASKLKDAVKHIAGMKGFKKYMKKSKLAAFHLTAEQGDAALNRLHEELGAVAEKLKK